ncbi:MAG: hypothetical protein ABIL39_08405 [candidate division WOR-3 bacterium]
MKNLILITILIIAIARISYAHPPSDIVAEFDTTNKILQVTVQHPVRDAQKHYINKIEIELNGSKIIEQKSKQQTDNTMQKYLYILPEAKLDDSISIEAYCNISGKKKMVIQINEIIKKVEN